MMVATIVAMIATFRVVRNAASTASRWMRSLYQRVEKPVQCVPLLRVVEAEHDEHDDRREQEEEHDDRVQLEVARAAARFSSGAAPCGRRCSQRVLADVGGGRRYTPIRMKRHQAAPTWPSRAASSRRSPNWSAIVLPNICVFTPPSSCGRDEVADRGDEHEQHARDESGRDAAGGSRGRTSRPCRARGRSSLRRATGPSVRSMAYSGRIMNGKKPYVSPRITAKCVLRNAWLPPRPIAPSNGVEQAVALQDELPRVHADQDSS